MRACSARIRSDTSSSGLRPSVRTGDLLGRPHERARTRRCRRSTSTPWSAMRMRSRPAPVSMLGFGSGDLAVVALVELHEHEVPDLDVAVRVARRRAAVGAVGVAEVPEQLRRRPARPGVAHPPEVVRRRAAGCAPRGSPTSSLPDPVRLVVGDVHGHPEPLRVELEHLGEELPRPRDRLGLEVVAEAEVAEHLEEAEVAVGAADVVEVVVLAARPDAFLRPRPPAARAASRRRRSTA